jgi:hypothetical protein
VKINNLETLNTQHSLFDVRASSNKLLFFWGQRVHHMDTKAEDNLWM